MDAKSQIQFINSCLMRGSVADFFITDISGWLCFTFDTFHFFLSSRWISVPFLWIDTKIENVSSLNRCRFLCSLMPIWQNDAGKSYVCSFLWAFWLPLFSSLFSWCYGYNFVRILSYKGLDLLFASGYLNVNLSISTLGLQNRCCSLGLLVKRINSRNLKELLILNSFSFWLLRLRTALQTSVVYHDGTTIYIERKVFCDRGKIRKDGAVSIVIPSYKVCGLSVGVPVANF